MADFAMPGTPPTMNDIRAQIVVAAAKLVGEGGAAALTTRAVAGAAGVQAPVIYRLFGDKRGLLDAVAEAVFAAYVAQKAERSSISDPVDALRAGWDDHIAFGLANPDIFVLTNISYPEPLPRAALAGKAVLRERVRAIARAGRLRLSEERAVDLMHAIGVGTVLALIEKRADKTEGLAEAAWEILAAEILAGEAAVPDVQASVLASALRARSEAFSDMTPGELLLLDELLRRISESRQVPRNGGTNV